MVKNNKEITVLYDSIGIAEPYGGVSRYFYEIICNIKRICKVKLAIVETCNKYFQSPPFSLPAAKLSGQMFCPSINFKGKYRLYDFISRISPFRMLTEEYNNKMKFDEELQKGDFDILHLTGPHFVGNYWRRIVGKKPFVVTIHDLIPEIVYRNKCLLSERREILLAASHIISVSNSTKNDIMRIYNIPEDKISVVYHGVHDFQKGFRYGQYETKRYLLYVGRREGYKNYTFFITALADLMRREKINVVCVGNKFNSAEMLLHRRLHIEDLISAVTCSDEELLGIYNGALCLVYPSLYEGFGLPIVEAFAARCPVITARGGSLSEIADKAALYFEYGKPETLVSQVKCVLEDDNVRNNLLLAGIDRAKLFDWNESAKTTFSVYKKVLMEM